MTNDLFSNSQGKNLIFLVSQPRAGSTMLQRILGGHPDIHTVSEPWIMLHPLLALRPDDMRSEIDPFNNRVRQFKHFLLLINADDAEALYFEQVGKFYGSLYDAVRKTTRKGFFLDKTPRYYYIIPELYRTFPQAKFIILFRNPLAILMSMLTTWAKGNVFWLSNSGQRHDLLSAPRLLVEGAKILGGAGLVCHYEDIVSNPKEEVRKITEFIGIEYSDSIVNYGDSNLPSWNFGDQNSLYSLQKPKKAKAQEWIEKINNYKTWRLVNDYLEYLSPEIIEKMGYSYAENMKILLDHKTKYKKRLSLSLSFLLKTDSEKTVFERTLTRFLKKRDFFNLND